MRHPQRPTGPNRRWAAVLAAVFSALSTIVLITQLTQAAANPSPRVPSVSTASDWPQLGHDPQRTNYTTQQVDPPYCYAWKWYEVPMASRAQPVVVSGRLFIGSMDGVMYTRDATTGASLWTFNAGSPIRHSAGVMSDTVIFSTQAGDTYALDTINGALKWKIFTGSSSTAPLLDAARGRIYVASSNGQLTALNLSNGSPAWQYDSGAPILTRPR